MPRDVVRSRGEVVDRRWFIRALGGGAAAAGLMACEADGPDAASRSTTPERAGGPAPTVPGSTSSDDVSVVADARLTTTDATTTGVGARSGSIVPPLVPLADLQTVEASAVHITYAPDVPPPVTRSDQRIVEFSLEVVESVCPLDPESGVEVAAWGFRIGGDTDVTCGTPGPVLRARVGDLARITVTNPPDATNPHSIDVHAVTGQGGGSAGLMVAPGETATVNARLLCPGVFLYHGASGDVPMHVAHGMYGMFIVDPQEPLPVVDHEWAIMRSEWYVAQPDDDGFAAFDSAALLNEHPRYVTFNGRIDALTGENSLRMDVGERTRFYMINVGLNLAASFRPTGAHWDVVYPEGATHPFNPVIRGARTTLVGAGCATVTELVGHAPSSISLVDQALVRTFYKGGLGAVVVSGDQNAVFSVGDDGLAAATEREPEPAASSEVASVGIPLGAWNPDSAEIAFSPQTLSVRVGTTVTWQNTDTVGHTVTSGTSTGEAGVPDGVFDSGTLEPRQRFEHTFAESGSFPYFCQPHPWMTGQVIVTD